jgi:uncharacterized glyoxalase superfamily protein PhnB
MHTSFDTIHSVAPVIATADIERSLEYYTTVLGFEFDFKYGEPPVYAGIKSGSVEIYFSIDHALAAAVKEKNLNPEVFIWVTDADGLFNKHKNRGAEIIEPPTNRPWGARQYVIKDINGYFLKFAQPL